MTTTSQGYPKLASVFAHSPDYAIFRRFGFLAMLNLMSLQARLVELEGQLRDTIQDDDRATDEKISIYSQSFWDLQHAGEATAQQRELLESSRVTLEQYYSLLEKTAAIDSMPRPRGDKVSFLDEWLKGEFEGKSFLRGRELDTWNLKNQRDFICVSSEGVDSGVYTRWIHPQILSFYNRYFGKKRQQRAALDDDNHRVLDYEQSRVLRTFDVLFKYTSILISSLLPALTILILYREESTEARIGTTIGLTGLLGLALALFTNAQLKEIFTATAAFAAVEVVFIGSANAKS